jgi:3-isopropylmalate/(R)-2-methylmalate dehydratase small subunit
VVLKGFAHVFGDHINTDYIISGKYKSRLTDLDEMAKHIMEDIRFDFYKEIKPGNFIVGGLNFGCGSSREAAAWVIKKAGISAVLAKDFARIFFRNAINVGIPVLRVDTSSIREGDKLKIDLNSGMVENLTNEEVLKTQPLPAFIQKILDAGGMENYLKTHDSLDL